MSSRGAIDGETLVRFRATSRRIAKHAGSGCYAYLDEEIFEALVDAARSGTAPAAGDRERENSLNALGFCIHERGFDADCPACSAEQFQDEGSPAAPEPGWDAVRDPELARLRTALGIIVNPRSYGVDGFNLRIAEFAREVLEDSRAVHRYPARNDDVKIGPPPDARAPGSGRLYGRPLDDDGRIAFSETRKAAPPSGAGDVGALLREIRGAKDRLEKLSVHFQRHHHDNPDLEWTECSEGEVVRFQIRVAVSELESALKLRRARADDGRQA